MILSITGHRPKDFKTNELDLASTVMYQFFYEYQPSTIYVGMADGVDQYAALVARRIGIPYIAVRPYAGHQAGDPKIYKDILLGADNIVVLNESLSYPGPWVMHNRNHYMVDNSDTTLGVWSGKESGGTYECLMYARNKSTNSIATIAPGQYHYHWRRNAPS